MKKEAKSLKLFLVTLFCSSFFLNFLWESLHGAFLYQGIGQMPSAEYVPLILYATSVDSALIFAMWAITALIFKDPLWSFKKIFPPRISFIFLGLLFAVWIEIKSVFIQHKWIYSSLMPVLFGIGISPLIQLIITGILAVKISNQMSS